MPLRVAGWSPFRWPGEQATHEEAVNAARTQLATLTQENTGSEAPGDGGDERDADFSGALSPEPATAPDQKPETLTPLEKAEGPEGGLGSIPERGGADSRVWAANLLEVGVQDLIDEFGRLPGIGPKSAQRIAFHLLQAEQSDVRRLAAVLVEVKDKLKFCTICFNVSSEAQCRICRDPRRDGSVLCVVEEFKDVVAIEQTREFRGRYHVLGGSISPIEGIGPDQLRIEELMTRLADGMVTETILATDPDLEGEATATYLTKRLSRLGLRVTRLGSGLPVGGGLEYVDEVTLGRALAERKAAHH